MKILANYHVCNHCVIGEKTFKDIVIGTGKLPGLSRNVPLIGTEADAESDWITQFEQSDLPDFILGLL